MKKILFVAGVFAVAFAILFISIFYSSSITYSISEIPPQPTSRAEIPNIDYILPYAGSVLPDSPFWFLKALRDKVWFGVTVSHLRRSQLALLFADKRLVMAEILFRKGKADVALSTFTKGEKYLTIAVREEVVARSQGIDTNELLQKIALSTLKHREITESLIQLAPDDARPIIVATSSCTNDAYEAARDALYSEGLPVPENPFNRD